MINVNSVNQWLAFRVLDSAGDPVIGLTNTEFTITYSTNVGTAGSYTLSSGSLGATHAEGLIIELGDGWYWLGLKDAALTAIGQVAHAIICGTAGNTSIVPTINVIDPNAYKATIVTVSDKTGFSLSTAGVLAIWHQALATIVTASSVGKLIKDFLNATITSRSSHTANDAQADVSGLATAAGQSSILTAITAVASAVWAFATRTLTSGASPSVEQIDTQLTTSHGAGSWREGAGGTGTGSRSLTVIVQDANSYTLESINVDLDKSGETYNGRTNLSGSISFGIENDGTYRIVPTRARYSLTSAISDVLGALTLNTDLISFDANISANQTITIVMTLDALGLSSPTAVTGVYECIDADANIVPGEVVTIKLIKPPTTAGIARIAPSTTKTSGADGKVLIAVFPGEEYEISVGGITYNIVVPATATGTINLNSISSYSG